MKFLLVNPYICDFACYDYWMKPLGLLYLSALLKSKGHEVQLIDCADRHHPVLPETEDKKYGTGHFVSNEIPKPDILKQYSRKYKAYGIYGGKLNNILKNINPPDMVVMTSVMTYWYPGVKTTAEMIKELFPGVPLVLGGIYATLCERHARKNIPADYIFTGNVFNELFKLIDEDEDEFANWPAPDYSHYNKVPYIVFRTSAGCPKKCSFCGIKSITLNYQKKSAEKIRNEINYLYKGHETRDFVFYDDALMDNDGFIEYLHNAPDNLRFHTPNGMEVKRIDRSIAKLLKRTNFIDPCLSVDIVDEDRMKKSSGKLKMTDIETAAENMFNAGYKHGEVSAYLIAGLPGQGIEEIRKSIEYLHALGLRIKLAEYAVVPGSKDARKFDDAVIEEPLLHNNSLFPSFSLEQRDEFIKIKNYAVSLNNEF